MFEVTKCDLSAGEALLDYQALIQVTEMAINAKVDQITEKVALICNDFRTFPSKVDSGTVLDGESLENASKGLRIALEVYHTLLAGKRRLVNLTNS